jgi:hypothetical protein
MTVIVQPGTDSNGNPQPMVYDSDTKKVIVDSNGYVINGGQRLVNIPSKTEYLSTLKTQTLGLQEAENYLGNIGGGNISAKKNNYNTQAVVNITHDNISIEFESGSVIKPTSTSFMLLNSISNFKLIGNNSAIWSSSVTQTNQNNAAAIYPVNCTNFQIKDWIFMGYSSPSEGTNNIWQNNLFIGFDSSSYGEISNITMYYAGTSTQAYGINLYGDCDNVNIHDIWAYDSINCPLGIGTYGNTSTFTTLATNIKMDRIYISGVTYGDGIDIFDGNNIILSNTIIKNVKSNSVAIGGSEYYPLTNVTLKNVTSYKSGGEGIVVGENTATGGYNQPQNYFTISNCYSIDSGQGGSSGYGIAINAGSYHKIIGNTCYDDQSTPTQSYGIYISYDSSNLPVIGNIEISNNMVDNNGTAGIYNSLQTSPTDNVIIGIHDNHGYNPVGFLTAPTVATGNLFNNFGIPVLVFLTIGSTSTTVTYVTIGGSNYETIGTFTNVTLVLPLSANNETGLSLSQVTGVSWLWFGN